MRMNDKVSIGDLYGDMLNDVKKTIVKESKTKMPENAFTGNTKQIKLKGGPDGVDGFHPALNELINQYDVSSKTSKEEKKKADERSAKDYFTMGNFAPKEEDEEDYGDEERDDDYSDELTKDKFAKSHPSWSQEEVDEYFDKNKNRPFFHYTDYTGRAGVKVSNKTVNASGVVPRDDPT